MQSAARPLTNTAPPTTFLRAACSSALSTSNPLRQTRGFPLTRKCCLSPPATMPSAAVLPPIMAGQLSSQTGRLRRTSKQTQRAKVSASLANVEAPISGGKVEPKISAVVPPKPVTEVISAAPIVSSLAGNAAYEAERNTFERQLSSLDLTIIQEPSKEQVKRFPSLCHRTSLEFTISAQSGQVFKEQYRCLPGGKQ